MLSDHLHLAFRTSSLNEPWEKVIFVEHNNIGTFSRVKLATSDKNDRDVVAIKIVNKGEIIRTRQVEHLMAEAELLANLKHPFIVFIKALKLRLTLMESRKTRNFSILSRSFYKEVICSIAFVHS